MSTSLFVDAWPWLVIASAALLAVFGARAFVRALVTFRAVAWIPTVSGHLSPWVRARHYSEDEVVCADGAEGPWIQSRRQALNRLASSLEARYARSIAWGNAIRESFSDLRFTDANRVPFPFRRVMREKFNLCSVVTASKGPRLNDLDGHWSLDVGSS